MSDPNSFNVHDIINIIYSFLYFVILIVTIYFIKTSAIKAVKVGRQLNDEQNKYTAKRNLFLNLFALRGTPVHANFVNGLNQIDVVFHDTPPVLMAWHTYHDSLGIKGIVNQLEVWHQHRISLLSAMAQSLGYGTLQQVDMMKYYYPQRHEEWEQQQDELRSAELLFYKTAGEVYQRIIDKADEDSQAQVKPIEPNQTK